MKRRPSSLRFSSHKPLPSSVLVGVEGDSNVHQGFEQVIEYEFLLCESCKIVGHLKGDCSKLSNDQSTLKTKKANKFAMAAGLKVANGPASNLKVPGGVEPGKNKEARDIVSSQRQAQDSKNASQADSSGWTVVQRKGNKNKLGTRGFQVSSDAKSDTPNLVQKDPPVGTGPAVNDIENQAEAVSLIQSPRACLLTTGREIEEGEIRDEVISVSEVAKGISGELVLFSGEMNPGSVNQLLQMTRES